jgi:ABC-type transporter Mla subunit MlaD
MADRQMRVRLGLFVAAALTALTALVVTFGGTPNLFSTRNKYTVFFPEAPGLSVGTPVRKAGVRIGEVTGLELDEASNRVRVRIETEAQYKPRDSEEAVITRGLLSGDTTLDFIPKADEKGNLLPVGEPYPPGSEIEGVPPLNTQRLISQAQTAVPNANEALARFTTTMSKFENVGPKAEKSFDEITAFVKSAREIIPELRQTNKQVQEFIGTQAKADPADPDPPANLKTLTREVQEFVRVLRPFVENLNAVVKDNQGELAQVLGGLRLLLQNANEVLGEDTRRSIASMMRALDAGANDLLSKENRQLVADILKKVDAASGDLKATLASARLLVTKAEGSLKEIDEAVKSAGAAFKDAQTTVKGLNARIEQVKTILDDIQKASKPLGETAGPAIKSVGTAADELAKTVAEARTIIKLLQQPDGTFGKVLNDPQLYNQLVESAAALTRTLTRAEKVAKDLEVFADKVARKPETIGIGGALRPSTGLKESPFAPVAPFTPFPTPPPAVPGPGGLTPIPPTGNVIPPTSSYKLKDGTDSAATILPGPRVQPIQPVKGPVGER